MFISKKFDEKRFHLKADVILIDLLDKNKNIKAQTIVDRDDFDKVWGRCWSMNGSGYVQGDYCFNDGTGRAKTEDLAHVIMGHKKGMTIDHIYGNKLDNRKCKLRRCLQKDNNLSKLSYKNGKSKYKGVWWHKKNRKWIASIGYRREIIYLGSFVDEKEAATMYNEAALKYHGEFALLNQI